MNDTRFTMMVDYYFDSEGQLTACSVLVLEDDKRIGRIVYTGSSFEQLSQKAAIFGHVRIAEMMKYAADKPHLIRGEPPF